MPAWSAPSADALAAQLTSSEILLLNTVQGSDETGAAILALVVAEVRDAIGSGGYPLNGDDGTLPIGLHNDAIAVARWRWLIALPKLTALQTKERSEANDRAEKKFARIAEGKRRPEPPPPAEGAPASVSIPAGTWNSQNKILGRTEPVPRPGIQGGGAGRYANEDAPEDRT